MKDPIEVVREMWDAHTRGDGRASLEAFNPDVEWDGLIIRRVGFSDPAEALPAVRSWKT